MSGSLSPKPMVDASDDRGHLLTEQSNPRSRQLDTLPVDELVDLFISEDVKPQQAVQQRRSPLPRPLRELPSALLPVDACSMSVPVHRGGSAFWMLRNVPRPSAVLRAGARVLAGGAPALLRSSEGLEDLRDAGADELRSRGLSEGDCVGHRSRRDNAITCTEPWITPSAQEPWPLPWRVCPPIRQPCHARSISACSRVRNCSPAPRG